MESPLIILLGTSSEGVWGGNDVAQVVRELREGGVCIC